MPAPVIVVVQFLAPRPAEPRSREFAVRRLQHSNRARRSPAPRNFPPQNSAWPRRTTFDCRRWGRCGGSAREISSTVCSRSGSCFARSSALVKAERFAAIPRGDGGSPPDAANRREIFGGALQHVFELQSGRVELVDFDQRPPKRHARGQITWMDCQPAPADGDGVLVVPGPPASSASWAKAIDAGSFWTRRRSSSMRGLSATGLQPTL